MKEWELEDQELVEANNEKQNDAGIKWRCSAAYLSSYLATTYIGQNREASVSRFVRPGIGGPFNT